MLTTNIIEVYVQDKPICDDWQMGGAVIGIQDMDAIRSVTPDQRNNGQWGGTGINEAWRFTPNGDPNYSIEWSDDSGNIVGDTESITVSPEVTTTYRAKITYTNCDLEEEVFFDETTVVVNRPYNIPDLGSKPATL